MCIILLCGVQIANIWLGRSITEVTYIIIIAQHTAQPTCYVGHRENGKSINLELVTTWRPDLNYKFDFICIVHIARQWL